MQIDVQNFVRVKAASIECSPIALVVGANDQGKSSLALAAALAATGIKVPYGFTQARAKELVHDGEASASIAIGAPLGENEQTIKYPACTVEATGGNPSASLMAVGLVSLVDMTEKDRATALQKMIKSTPTYDDLKSALVNNDIPEEAVKAVWKIIEDPVNGGWDKAFKRTSDKRAERKGEWSVHAGEDYGAEKSVGWRPAGFTSDLMGNDVTEQSLSSEVTIAQAKVDDRLKEQGGNVADLNRLQELADSIPEKEQAKAEAQQHLDDADAELKKAHEERAKLPATSGDKVPPSDACPHCGEQTEIVIAGGGLAPVYKLKKPGTSKAPTKAQADRIASLDGSISRWTAEKQRATNRLGTCSAELRAATEAKALLEEMERKPTEASDDAEALVNEARADLKRAQDRLSLWKRWTATKQLQKMIAVADKVVAELAPTGLRQRKMAEALGLFNNRLADLAKVAKWPAVSIEPDMGLSYNGRPITSVTGKSHKMRARYLLAFGAADIDGSQLVICDEADILESSAREGLLQLAKASGKPTLICMTASVEVAPNLAKWKGWGATYLMKDGVATALPKP